MAQAQRIIDLDVERRRRGGEKADPESAEDRADRDWFEALMRSHGGRLRGYYRYKLRDEDLADELVVEAFFRVWSSRRTFRGDAKASTWLWTIARRVLAAHFDQKRRRAPELLVDELPDTAAPTEDEDAETRHRALALCLKQLNDKVQQSCELVWLLGYSFVEAAAILDEAPDAVRMRLKRARAPLQKCLTEKGIIGED